VADWLAALYRDGDRYWSGLQPDTLAEYLVDTRAFGWGGRHVHRFVIHGVEYGVAYPGGPPGSALRCAPPRSWGQLLEADEGDIVDPAGQPDPSALPGETRSPVGARHQRRRAVGAAELAQVRPELLRVTAGRTVLAYGAEFDHSVIARHAHRDQLEAAHLADPVTWACRMWPVTKDLAKTGAKELGRRRAERAGW
jgi:hypothetical protein